MKRNYWLKLKEDFFQQPYIKKLRKIAGGAIYTIIYQKILLMSINTGGIIHFQGIEATLEEELALILDEEVENVKVTLQFMKSTKLIEKTADKDVFLLPEILTIIGSESQSAQRVRDFRERKRDEKALQCNTDVTEGNQNVTLDIDTDRDKETDKDKKKYKEKNESVNEIVTYLNKVIHSKYKQVNLTTALIRTRLKEGFTVKDFKTVIDNKHREWGTDSTMSKYLRPQTLFGNKFEGYLNQRTDIAVANMKSGDTPKTFDQIRNENIVNTGKAVLKKIMDKYEETE